jgi:tRNA-splicing ligase RtcB
MARDQLGTVGSGNHYVDLFEDEDGWIWIGVHFGSRGLGHKTATEFIRLGGGKDGIDVDPTLLRQDSELGQKYIAGRHRRHRCYPTARRGRLEDCDGLIAMGASTPQKLLPGGFAPWVEIN